MTKADIDGDGVDDPIVLESTADSALFVICTAAGGRPLQLALSTWYLAVLDIEQDGIDEVFFAALDYDTTADRPGGRYQWLDTSGDQLRLYSEASAWLSDDVGIGCVDHNGDGVRDLVRLSVNPDTSTPDTVAWVREISSARPFDGPNEPVSGQFVVGSDNNAIDLLTQFSCGDAIIDPTRVVPSSICDEADSRQIEVDLDNDETMDFVGLRYSGTDPFTGPAIVVCLGNGQVDEIYTGGMGEVFGVSDAVGDRPTMWGGGTTVSAAYFQPYVVVDNRIRAMSDGRDPIGFSDGWRSAEQLSSFGCDDLDHDGQPEFVQTAGIRDGDEMVWTRTSWDAHVDLLTKSTETKGRLPWPQPSEGEWPEYPPGFDALITGRDSCGDL